MSPLLRLPKELRYEIYDHLCRQESKQNRTAHAQERLITYIDQMAPTELSITCRFLCDEIRAYFYSKATLGFYPLTSSSIFDSPIEPIALRAIQNARKICICVFWNAEKDGDVTDKHTLPYSMNGWLADLVDLLLREAKMLEFITLRVYNDMPLAVGWELKEWMLKPLERTAGKFRWGLYLVWAREKEEVELRERLTVFLKELNWGVAPVVEQKPALDLEMDSCCVS
ncbi:hypothetical protein J4E93_007900 [Alternaria ventricosa]|uniref:uncharacterized protein n=1 Tax=Alternaria ventricosa TaxID=1187951 RepID=UPI0020C46C2F|nr:uncharacterized protein J4E93_007900 [Alternaria ventricosa]KAI4641801.1 hypothetical protein J4E93_007900 [Alternaria ventricosa]